MQRKTQTALAKEVKAQLDLLHESALSLCSKTGESGGHEQDVANVQVAPTAVEVSHPTTMQTLQTSPVNYQDTSLALKYIDSIKVLRDELAEREKECAEATQEKSQLQVLTLLIMLFSFRIHIFHVLQLIEGSFLQAQYNLISVAHNELLQRMNVLVQQCASEARRDVPGDIQLLAAAQTVMRGQEDALQSQEQKLVALNSVRIRVFIYVLP